MADANAVILMRLSDTDHVFADAADDIRGRTVRDPDGAELGTVKDLLVDLAEKKVRFVSVESGGLRWCCGRSRCSTARPAGPTRRTPA